MVQAEEIVRKVEQHRNATASWRDSMDLDLRLYDGFPYQTESAILHGEGASRDDGGYRSYTSNEPQTYGKKVIATLSLSRPNLRVPAGVEFRDKRDFHDLKERLGIGMLHQADDWLVDVRMEKTLQESLAWYTSIRGAYAVRALLVKSEDGGQRVEIQPWDPRDTYWGMDKDGMAWACLKQWYTVDRIAVEFGITMPERDDSNELVEVYSYYDRKRHMIVIPDLKDGFAKKPLNHGAVDGSGKPKVPVHIGGVGSRPLLNNSHLPQRSEITGGNVSGHSQVDYDGWGESIFVANRGIYPLVNELRSIYLHLVAAARERTWVYSSAGGEKQLSDDPNQEGGVIPIDLNEHLDPIPLPEMTKDAAALLGLVEGEMQRGALPHSIFGELQFQLSGIAIDTLRQNMLTVISPALKAMDRAVKQILTGLTDQYVGGAFAPMKLAGIGVNREYFDEEISPDDIRDLPGYLVKHVANLPHDDAAKIAMAQLAREGPNGVPLYDDLFIHEEIMETSDVGAVMDRINLQMAERGHPSALALTLMNASEARGETEYAGIYLRQLMIEMLNQQLQLMQGQLITSQGPQLGPSGGSSGPPPGQSGPPPTPPGQPRPGAREFSGGSI